MEIDDKCEILGFEVRDQFGEIIVKQPDL